MNRLPTRALLLVLALGTSRWCAAQGVVTVPDAPIADQGIVADDFGGQGCAGHGCGSAAQGCAGCGQCCTPVCKSCQVVPDTVKHVHTHYKCKCADFCLPKRLLSDLFRFGGKSCGCAGSCDGCGSSCGCGDGCCQSGCCHSCPPATPPCCECKVRNKMVLLKKVVTQECPGFKCEPVCCPCGCPQGCGAGCGPAGYGGVETLPGGEAPLPGEFHPEAMPVPTPSPKSEPKKKTPIPPSASRRSFGRF